MSDSNAKAEELVEEIFNLWEPVVTDDPDNEYSMPQSQESAEGGAHLLSEIEACKPTDPELIDIIDDCRKITDTALRKHLASNRIVLILMFLYIILSWSFTAGRVDKWKKSDYTAENCVEKLEKDLASARVDLEITTPKNYEGAKLKRLLKTRTEKVELLSSITPAQYAEWLNSQAFKGMVSEGALSILYTTLFILYLWASFIPGWMINKRHNSLADRATPIFFRFIFKIIEFVMTMPTTTYYDVYSDGRRMYSTFNMTALSVSLVFRIMVPITIFIFLLGSGLITLPVLTAIALIRNKFSLVQKNREKKSLIPA